MAIQCSNISATNITNLPNLLFSRYNEITEGTARARVNHRPLNRGDTGSPPVLLTGYVHILEPGAHDWRGADPAPTAPCRGTGTPGRSPIFRPAAAGLPRCAGATFLTLQTRPWGGSPGTADRRNLPPLHRSVVAASRNWST